MMRGKLYDPLLDWPRQDASGAKHRVDSVAAKAGKDRRKIRCCRDLEVPQRYTDRLCRKFRLVKCLDVTTFRWSRR